MINVLFSGTGMVVARQKKAGKGAQTKLLGTLAVPPGGDAAQAARTLRDKLRKLKINDKHLRLILCEQVVFKEFSHQPVGDKALQGFARIEARSVLREQADDFCVRCMRYGAHTNEKGEVTSMLLAVGEQQLKSLRAAFIAAGFSVDAVSSQFSAYAATLARVLPKIAPELTGAALDFGYEYTLISLYSKGELVSQRRLPGVLACLVPVVQEDTGCRAEEAPEKLAENKFTSAYPEKARAALLGFTYDILRTLRVLSAPLHIAPEEFVLSGAACRDRVFLSLVTEALGMPCITVDSKAKEVAGLLAPQGSVTGLMVLSGPAYDKLDLLDEIRQQKKGSVINLTTCSIVTCIAVLGLLVPFGVLLVKQNMVEAAQARTDALSDVQAQLDALTEARDAQAGIGTRADAVQEYRSNTGETLPRVLALFTGSYTLLGVSYDSEYGGYQVTFLSDTKENFLALKDSIYADGDYYLNPQMSIQRQTADGSYQCTMYFVPADYAALPAEEAASENTQSESTVSVTTDDLMEGVG